MHKFCNLVFLTFLFLTPVFSQDNKELKISIGTGIFNSTYYTNAKPRPLYNFAMEYSITKRHKISFDFLSGKHLYYDNIRSNNAVPLNIPGYEENANAEAEYSVVSALYKYELLSKKRISLHIGSGLGIMTQTMLYPYTTVIVAGPDVLETVDFRQSGWNDLCFPIRVDLDYNVSKKFQIGIIGGMYIQPDYPVLGQHLGLRLSYVIK